MIFQGRHQVYIYVVVGKKTNKIYICNIVSFVDKSKFFLYNICVMIFYISDIYDDTLLQSVAWRNADK